jgi:hypothetical protein
MHCYSIEDSFLSIDIINSGLASNSFFQETLDRYNSLDTMSIQDYIDEFRIIMTWTDKLNTDDKIRLLQLILKIDTYLIELESKKK